MFTLFISSCFTFCIPSLQSFPRYIFLLFRFPLVLPSVSPRSAALCRSSECSWWWLGFPIIPSLRISSSVSCSSILWTCTDTQTDRVTFVNDGLRVHVLVTPRLPCHEITWSSVLVGFMSQLGPPKNSGVSCTILFWENVKGKKMRRAHLWTSSLRAGRRRTELVDCSFAQPKHSKLDGGMLLRGDQISNIPLTWGALVFNNTSQLRLSLEVELRPVQLLR